MRRKMVRWVGVVAVRAFGVLATFMAFAFAISIDAASGWHAVADLFGLVMWAGLALFCLLVGTRGEVF